MTIDREAGRVTFTYDDNGHTAVERWRVSEIRPPRR
jgi:hypothetical protein